MIFWFYTKLNANINFSIYDHNKSYMHHTCMQTAISQSHVLT